MPLGLASRIPQSRADRGWLRLHLGVTLRRTQLDRVLARGADPDESSELALRARQLCGGRTRRSLARGIERAIAQAERYSQSTALPVNREEIARARPLLVRLAERLRAPEDASPRGVAAVRLLLTEDTSPIMSPGWSRASGIAGALEGEARSALAALDGRPGIPLPRVLSS
jgi:nucleotidyltransferase/DNA polymerase involved in DNA repair